MAILQLRPKHKIEKLLPEIEAYYAQPKSQILPETIAYLEDQVRSMQQQIDFAELQMLYGLIAGLKNDQQGVRSRYQQAIKHTDTFDIHVNFLMSFIYLNDFEYQETSFFAAKRVMNQNDMNQLDFMIRKAVSLGFSETILQLLKQKQKIDTQFSDNHLIQFYEKLGEIISDEKILYALFCDLNHGVMECNTQTLGKTFSYSEYDDTLIFNWCVKSNEAQVLFDCQNTCDEIMIDFEEKHQLNLNNLFVIIQAQEAYCV